MYSKLTAASPLVAFSDAAAPSAAEVEVAEGDPKLGGSPPIMDSDLDLGVLEPSEPGDDTEMVEVEARGLR